MFQLKEDTAGSSSVCRRATAFPFATIFSSARVAPAGHAQLSGTTVSWSCPQSRLCPSATARMETDGDEAAKVAAAIPRQATVVHLRLLILCMYETSALTM